MVLTIVLIGSTPAWAINTVLATINIGGTPWTMVMSPSGATAYFANTGGTTVSVVDTASNSVTGVITVGNQPTPMAVTPNGAVLYVVNWGDGSISVVNTNTNSVTSTITPTGTFSPDLRDIQVTPDGTKFVVSDLANDKVYVYATVNNALLATVAAGDGPRYISISVDGTTAYVTDVYASALAVINLSSYAASSITLSSSAQSLALTPDGSRIIAGHSAAPELSVITTGNNAVETTITTGARADHLAATNSTVYAATYSAVGGSIVTPVRLGNWTVETAIPVANKARQVLISPDGSLGYSLGETTATVTSFSTATNQVLASIPVGVSPAMAAFTPNGSRLYVTAASGSVYVIDTYIAPSSGPVAPLQQFGVPSNTQVSECAILAPESVDWPGVVGKRAQGWGLSYAEWPNSGAGGWVCSRQPVWLGQGWGFVGS